MTGSDVCRGGRATDPGTTMNQDRRPLIPALNELQEFTDMLRRRQDAVRPRLVDVVEAQLEMRSLYCGPSSGNSLSGLSMLMTRSGRWSATSSAAFDNGQTTIVIVTSLEPAAGTD